MAQNNGFTKNADLYASSLAHSEVPDLVKALQALPNLAGLVALDLATGTGHTAFFLASNFADVFAVDINDEMLRVAQEESDRQSLAIRFLKCPVEHLSFDDQTFDLVSCRLAAHHFADSQAWLAEARRVLRPSGQLLLIDNVVPEQAEVYQWINNYERKRDPSHVACLSKEEWTQRLQTLGFHCVFDESFEKELDFQAWMERMSKTNQEQDALWEELLQSPSEVQQILKPKLKDDELRSITLCRQIIVAQLQG